MPLFMAFGLYAFLLLINAYLFIIGKTKAATLSWRVAADYC